MLRVSLLMLTLWALLISVATAGAPPSFCRCTCFSNSTIIPLSNHAPPAAPAFLETRAPTGSCSLCNKAFCLAQRLPICKGATQADVFTACFQRDSRKDQIVVIAFITGTLGLLGWAAVRKLIDKRKSSNFVGDTAQQGYTPVGR